jgi:hypothetical protein
MRSLFGQLADDPRVVGELGELLELLDEDGLAAALTSDTTPDSAVAA